MKKLLIQESEKNEILSMHKALVKEQAVTESPDLVTLRKAIKGGCLKNGKILSNSDKTKYIYRATTKSGKEVDFFGDMTYKFRDGSKTGNWKCDQITTITTTDADNQAKIQTEIEKGWATLDTLRKDGVDLNTLDITHDKQEVGGTTLYRLKGKSSTFTPGTSSKEFNQEQLAFISKFEKQGFKLNPSRVEQGTMVKITGEQLGAPADLFPNGLIMWYNPNAQKDIKKSEQGIGDVLKTQQIDRDVCRDKVQAFYKAFKRKNTTIIDQSLFETEKRKVQACKDQWMGKWGVLGGGKKLDEMLGILSGELPGGPSTYDVDSIYRLK